MNKASSHASILRKGLLQFFSGTFLSRVTGLFREVIMAFFFGTSATYAAFLIAFRWANFFRRFLGEGNLLAGFVPAYEEQRREGQEQGARFLRDLFATTIVLVGVPIAVVLLLFPMFSSFLPAENRLILQLLGWMLPSILFLSLFSISAGYLHCEGQFFRSGVAPFVLNVVWIGTILLFRNRREAEVVFYLSCGILLGYMAQWILVAGPSLRAIASLSSWKERLSPQLFSPQVRATLRFLTLTLLGVGATQLNSAIDLLFARYSDGEGPAFLSYAMRPYQLPMALFGIAIASSALPNLSRTSLRGERAVYREILEGAIQKVIELLLPSTVAILLLGGAGVNLLYGRGAFSTHSVAQTTLCLWGYSLSLLPSSLLILLTQAFYARGEYRFPSLVSVITVMVNFLLNGIFVVGLQWGPASLALTTSISAWLQCFFFFCKEEACWSQRLLFPLGTTLRNCSIGAILVLAYQKYMGSASLFWSFLVSPELPRDFLAQCAECLVPSLLFLLPFLPVHKKND